MLRTTQNAPEMLVSEGVHQQNQATTQAAINLVGPNYTTPQTAGNRTTAAQATPRVNLLEKYFECIKHQDFSGADLSWAEHTREQLSAESQTRLDWHIFNPDYNCAWHNDLSFPLICEIYQRVGMLRSIRKRGIYRIPNATINFLASRQIERQFTHDQILESRSFIYIQDVGSDGKIRRFWMLATSCFSFWHSGYLMPISTDGEILGIRIFRDISDPNPFLLQTAVSIK